jgi:phage-related protein
MAMNTGRNVGRVSIRVVPDTTRFRPDLKRKLEQIERTTAMSVRVDRANVDRTKFRESLRRQLAEFNDLDIDTKVSVTVDKARIRRGSLRKSIQEQFDAMKDIRVFIRPQVSDVDSERFKREIKRLVDNAKDTVNIGVNAQTAGATAQMRLATRPRFVEIFVSINKASLAKAVGTLAALSGARLTWKWIDDLVDKMRNLDKTLPTLLNWTSGITALIAALAGSVSGLVGIGQGLFSITPALLVLPGLFLNAVGSLTVLIVALKNSRTELAALGDDMNELGGIINTGFWDKARAPIVDLVKGLMPQLRNAFTELSAGVGEFTASLANAFGAELGGGRLEGIFKGIADGWRVLGTGAPGFAGAIVSLSEIAATYTPRLAAWFVRQANTFDAFLTSIATDGRLETWMQGAIASMYDLWSATTGFAGILEGIWTAADQAGSGGLKGFAEMLNDWESIVKSSKFQTGLAAVFRGSYVAMDAFGGAIESLGDLIGAMPDQFERFIGSVGGFLGGIFDEAFKALNNVNVAIGLDGFSAGLTAALQGITPALQPIAEVFGSFLGLLGDLAANLLPTAVGAIADLMPAVQGIIDGVEPVLKPLGDAVSSISSTLGPAVAGFVEAVTPAFQDALLGLGDAFVELTPHLAGLVDSVGPALATAIENLVPLLGPLTERLGGLVDVAAGLVDLSTLANQGLKVLFTGDFAGFGEFLQGLKNGGGFFAQFLPDAHLIGWEWVERLAAAIILQIANRLGDIAAAFASWASPAFAAGYAAVSQILAGFNAAFPGVMGWLGQLVYSFQLAVAGAGTWLLSAGISVMGGLRQGLVTGFVNVYGFLTGLPGQLAGALGNVGSILWSAGSAIMGGLRRGIEAGFEAVKSFVGGIAGWIAANKGPLSYDRRLLVPAGRSIMQGFNAGLLSGYEDVQGSIRGITSTIAGEFANSDGGRAGGANVNVTMPLLPGETPQEQRDNVIKEFKWAF